MRKTLGILAAFLCCLGTTAQTDSLRKYDIYFHEAMLQRQKGQHDAAFDLLQRSLELNPQASEAYYFLAQYYSEIKAPDKAIEHFKHATELEPANKTYMETLAHAYIAKQNYAEAIDVLERMYATDKSRQDFLEMLYRLYLQEKNFEKAIDVLDRMEAIDGKSERISLAKSGLYFQMSDHEKALEEIKALSDQYPNDLNYRTIYANTLLANGDNELAHDVLMKILEEEPDHVKAQQTLRNYFISMEDAEAVDSLTRCILLNPKANTEDKVMQLRQLISENEQSGGDSTQILTLFDSMLNVPQPDADIAEMKAAYMDLKQMPREDIAKALEQVLMLAPDRASARLHLVQYAWDDEDKDRVISLCQAARQYNPEEMAFYYYQGIAYYNKGDTDHALEAFQNGISVINEESSTEIVSDFYAVMGDLLFQKMREREAFAAYDSCLQWKPDNIGCLNNYAYYLSVKGTRLDEAEQMSYKTIKAEPKNSTYLDTYAWILFMQQRYAEARIYIDQALQNDSVIGGVLKEHAGDIYIMNGDTEGALKMWKEALELDPKNKILIRKIKRKKYIKQ
ncbi:tetratricopeptide repeat protein [Xylanibacter brevis]|uniref:tetratricopeptide repeat protein n=1 Tax=Xylanibacter brevis TaxID=83231 RepID=UPI000489CD47|nr:tetratricopeptide repeat protein [Xylanibacter brevis]